MTRALFRPLLVLGLSLAVASCGEGGGPGPAAEVLDLGTVVVGTSRTTLVPVASSEGLTVETTHPSFEARVASPTQVAVVLRPAVAGPVEAELQLTWPDRVEVWTVGGEGRWPTLERHPETVEMSGAAFADLWLWTEPEIEVSLAEDSAMPACPGASCVEILSSRVDRGLPATLRVYGPVSEPTSIAVRTCPAPECVVRIPVSPSELGAAVVFAAAPVGQASLRTVDWPGDGDVEAEHPELTIVERSEGRLVLQWSPGAPGGLQAELRSGGRRVSVLGYAVEVEDCRSEVRPDRVVFGATPAGAFATEVVEVRNRGPGACLWSGVEVSGAGFSGPAPMPRWLEAGEAARTELVFEPPTEGRFDGRLDLWLADAPGAGRGVALSGAGVVSDLEVLTEAVDFGVLEGCQGRTRPVRVLNRGHAAGRVVDASFSGAGAEVMAASYPDEVAASGLTVIDVQVASTPSGSVDALLDLTLQDSSGRGTYRIPVRAEPGESVWLTDEFQQLALPKTDLLLVIDPSVGGPLALPTLANLTALAQYLEAQRVDLRVAVLSTEPDRAGLERHRGSGEWLFDARAPDFVTRFVETAIAVGARTSSVSLAIARAHEAVTSSTAAEWVRPEAVLSIVALSARGDDSPDDVSQWVNRFLEIKGVRNTSLFVYSAIVGDPEDGCVDPEFTAEPAPRHYELVNRTGGIFQSICTSDWARALEPWSTITFGFKSRFFLTNQPIIETIEVSVNDVPTPGRESSGTINWTYDYATNSINFSPFGTPEPSASIVVRYRIECL